MSIEFREVTRGNRKIFVHVAGSVFSQGLRVSASSMTSRGNALPASVIPAPEGVEGGVLVVPVSQDAQTVTLRVANESGVVLQSVEHVLDPRESKLRSQVNTALRNKVAEAIRNCDASLPSDPARPQIEILRMIPDHDQEILHVEVRATGQNKDALSHSVELFALDPNGNSLVQGEVVTMGDALLADEQYPGTYHLRLTRSIRIPRGVPDLILWARSSSAAVGESWHLWDGPALQAERDRWHWIAIPADRDPAYDGWFRNRRAKEWELAAQRAVRFDDGPKFSLVVPLYNTPVEYFHDMVASVLAQSYANLELVLVNGSPQHEELGQAIEAVAGNNSQVKVVALDQNQGIVGNTNAGVAAATGDFVCFLDHDDVLEPDCLYWYARGISTHANTDLLYCDEDKLVDGHYEQPFLKPDWSPDTLCSQNYVCHLLCVRRSVLEQVGPESEDFEGAQDHDLALRVGEVARNVYHVRRVLYHWRVHPGSTATDAGEKSYTASAGVRAVQAHLDRCGIQGQAYEDERIPNVYHVRYRFDAEPLVSVLIPNKDAVNLLEPCLDSIRSKSTYHNYEVVVVENNSTDPATFAYYERVQQEDPRVRVVTYDAGGEFNYSKLMNYGVSQTRGEYVLMLNNDTKVITPGWIEALLGHAREEKVGCVGAKLLYPDGTMQHAGVIVHRGGPYHTGIFLPGDCDDYFHSFQITRNYSGVTGACLMIRRALYDQMGGLDESFAADYNDVDFCLRVLRAGYRNVYEPTCELYHLESVSRGKNETRGRAIRFSREKGRLQALWPERYVYTDPYVNPNIWPVNAYWHLDV